MTIAVNLGGPREKLQSQSKQEDKKDSYSQQIQDSIQRFIRQFKSDEPSSDEPGWDVYEIASSAFDAMQSSIARQKLAAYPPDKVIDIPRNACTLLEFDRAEELIELGYKKAQDAFGAGS